MTAVVRPPRPLLPPGPPALQHEVTLPAALVVDDGYVGRHRSDRRARHAHAAAAVLAVMLAWIPAASARRGRHRRH